MARLNLPALARDADRRLLVIASNGVDKLVLLRWADDRLGRVERLTRIATTSSRPAIRIVLAPARTHAPPAAAEQRVERGAVVQRLTLRDMAIERTAADEGLCRLLVFGYVLDHWEGVKAGRNFTAWVERDVPAIVPDWIWRGLAGNLEPATRAAGSEAIVEAWRAGKLVPVAAFLRAQGGTARTGAPEPIPDEHLRGAFATMLMSWFLSHAESDTRLDMLCARLAAGELLTPEVLAGTMPGCASVIDLEERWDAWILAQERMIYAPGDTRPADLQRLKAALIVTRGMDGVPVASSFPLHGSLRDLASQRKAPWLPSVLSAKIMELRMLALGRGGEFRDVVERYCAYLTAVAERRRERKLEKLWRSADEALQALTTKMTGQPWTETTGSNAPVLAAEAETNDLSLSSAIQM